MTSKRANGEGAIYRDKARDRWVAALVVGRDDDGKLIRRRFTGPTRKAVTARMDDARKALDQGLAIPDPTTTIATYATWWLAEVLPGEGLAPATVRWYGDIVKLIVADDRVAKRTLTGPRALTPADVETLCAAQRTARTADAVRTTLSKMLRAAEVRGLVGRNVARLARPRGDEGKARKIKALTATEVRALLDALDGTRWHPVALVGVTTGLRPGELLALHWPDVHLTGEARVVVRHAISWVGSPTLKAPKRARSHRTVPLVPEAVAALKAWRREQAAEQLAAGTVWSTDWPGLTFTSETGAAYARHRYHNALTDAAGVTPHRLRHSYATHLLEGGTPIHHVAELLGDTVAVVEATYSHVLRPKHEVVEVARGLLGGAS